MPTTSIILYCELLTAVHIFMGIVISFTNHILSFIVGAIFNFALYDCD
nr:MAG TPA: hypothetical protein [Caudoviricetes sp.]